METALSEVDGERGRLVVKGRTLEVLAGLSFEGMLSLLWDREPVSLGQARCEAFERLPWATLLTLAPMDALRVALAAIDGGPEMMAATLSVVVGSLAQGRPIRPDAALGHAADLLRMLRGGEGTPAQVRALDGYLVTVAEHGMNASTYAARVVASTRAGLKPAVTAALCALEGPLHGGAPGPVLDMLDAIGRPDGARTWLAAELDAGRRLMGFGHRIYRVRDPRADALKALVETLPGEGRLALAKVVEREARDLLRLRHPERPLDTNVEFFTALLLEAVGVPRRLFTPVFACGRVAGWCAHVEEQVRSGRLIRPESRYVGPQPALSNN